MDPREVERILLSLRGRVNLTLPTTEVLVTDGTGGNHTIWTDSRPVPFDSSYSIDARVFATDAGSPPTAYCGLERVQRYGRGPTGAAVMLGAAATKADTRSNVAFDMTFALDGNGHPYIQVTDGGIIALDWKIWINVLIDR